MAYETNICFEDEKKHPIVVEWMNRILQKNIALLEETVIAQAVRGSYLPIRKRTGERSDRDPYLAKKIREKLDYRLPARWQTMTGYFRMDFTAQMSLARTSDIVRLEEKEKHRLCGLVSGPGTGGLTLTLHHPVLAIPVRQARFSERYIHAYRLNPLLAEMLPKLLYAFSSLTSHYPEHAIAVRSADCQPTEYIKPGKKYTSTYVEGSPSEFCIRYTTSF